LLSDRELVQHIQSPGFNSQHCPWPPKENNKTKKKKKERKETERKRS
jgi:hypothetical protein